MEAPLGGEGDEHEDGADRRHDPRRCELQRRRLVGHRHCPSARPLVLDPAPPYLLLRLADWLPVQASRSARSALLPFPWFRFMPSNSKRHRTSGRTWRRGDSRGEGDSGAHCPRSEELSGGPGNMRPVDGSSLLGCRCLGALNGGGCSFVAWPHNSRNKILSKTPKFIFLY